MEMLVIILAVLAGFIFIKYWSFRRQVRDICRQLAFMQSHRTNRRLQLSDHAPELRRLAAYLNEIYDGQAAYMADMQQKDRRMKELLVSVSHDIRTPLTALKGYLSLLLAEEEPKRRQRYADIMRQKTDDLDVLLEELFTYTKLQNEDYVLPMERQDMTAIVMETLFSFYESFRSVGIEPQMDVCDVPVDVLCSGTAMKRALSNILRNAQLHGSGRIAIRYGVEGDTAVFVCENTVAGPEKIDMDRVFERFYKADGARSRQSTGLGLSIAKGLVEKMGGQAAAKLEGEWFRVCVRFPLDGADRIETNERISKKKIDKYIDA